MDTLKLCDKCRKGDEETFHGYIGWVDNSCYECPICGNKMIDTIITIEEYNIIDNISDDISFLEAMINLKQKDPIEYQLKISQFKANLSQQESAKQVVEQKSTAQSNQRTCRFCGSTSFTPVKRKWSPLTGFLTNKTDLVCNNCGKKVQWIDR